MNRVCLELAVFSLWLLQACGSDEGNPGSSPNPPQQPIYNWTLQTSNTTLNFTDVFFIGSNTGWVVGEESVILATVNGGTEWPPVPITTDAEIFQAVFFTDGQKGWVVSGMREDPVGGKVLLTTNGGAYPE